MISTNTIKSNAIKCAVSNKIESYLNENKIGLYYDRDWTREDETKIIKWNEIEYFDIQHNFNDIFDKDYSVKLYLFYRYNNESYYHSILVKLYEQPTYHMLRYEYLKSTINKDKLHIIKDLGDLNHFHFNKCDTIVFDMPYDGNVDIYTNNFIITRINKD